MSKPWLKNYPNNVANEIDLHSHTSMLDIFHQSITKYKNNLAFSHLDSEFTFDDVDRLSRDFAAYLQTELKIKKGDRVALMCPNIIGFPIAMWGIIRVGAVQVNVNPMYTTRELKHQLNDAQVETIVIFSGSTKTLADVIEHTSIKNIITIDQNELSIDVVPMAEIDHRLTKITSFSQALINGYEYGLEEPDLSCDDLLFLQYTGGTTGISKGAMLTHGNVMANILQYQEFVKSSIEYGKEVVITVIPMYHIFALTVNTLCYFFFGAKNILITNPRDIDSFIDVWRQNNVTFFSGVNTLFNGLLHTPAFSELNFSSLKLVVGGGASVQEAVADKWQQVTGVPLHEGYGLSETSPVLTLNIRETGHRVKGIGMPLPSTDISIRDDNNNIVPQGEAGELCAKGPQVMAGYWHNIEATKVAMTDDGYFKTGDIAVLDEDGFFHIVDRKKDMVNVSGFNVYPNEVEAEIANMPGVLESVCVGVEDGKTGEALKLFIVKKEEQLTEQDVMAFCREKLTGYKVPKQIEFIATLPKSTVGKILRRELRVKNRAKSYINS